MSYIRKDQDGNIKPVSDGYRLIEGATNELNPAVKQIADQNEPVLTGALDRNPQDAHSMLQLLDDHYDSLNNSQKEMVDLHNTPQGFDSSLGQESVDKLVQFHDYKKKLYDQLDSALKASPAGQVLNGAMDAFKDTPTALDKAARVFNFFPALETGLIHGIKQSLSGQGTVMGGIQEGLKKNTGYADALKEFGVPTGPTAQFKAPHLNNVHALTPSGVAMGLTESILKGEKPAEMRPFGPVMSARGAVGLSLDILLDPTTYFEWGTNTPAKVAAKQGSESVLRFAGKTLLTDKELTRGMAALKATDFGKTVIEALDRFSAVQLAKGTTVKDLGEGFMKSFFPDHGVHADTARILERSDRFKTNITDQAMKSIKATFEKFTEEEKTQFIDEMFNRGQAERAAKMSLGPLTNPKFEEARKLMNDPDGVIHSLAKFAGIPDDVLRENYIPGIIEGVKSDLKNFKKGVGPTISGGALKSEFKLKPTALEDAYMRRAAELAQVGATRHAIKRIVKKYGATYEEAMAKGFTEFFPRDVARKFGLKFEEELGVPAGKQVFFPKQVMDTITEMAERQNVPTSAFLKVLGGATQQFKAYVTSIWPGFHARNAFSNQMLRFENEGWKAFNVGTNKLAFQTLIDSPKLAETTIELGKGTGKTVPLSVVKKWAENDGVRGTNKFIADTGGKLMDNLTDREISGKISRLINPDARKNDAVKIGREIGAFIEDHAKMTSYIQALQDGFSRQEAKSIVDASLFDYGHLTSFEKTVMQRVFPFYTFTRKNLEAQVSAALTHPGRQATVIKAIKDIHDDALSQLSPEKLEAFNELKNTRVLQSAFGIPVGFTKDEHGNNQVQWITGFGLPQEQVMDLFNAQGAYFQLNPALKIAGNTAFRALDQAGVISFKESYSVGELRFLFNDVFKTTPDRERLMQWVNNKDGFFAHPLTKFLDLKVIKRDVIKNGKPTGEKDYMFTANPVVLDVLRNTVLAKAMSTLRQYGDPNVDDTTDFLRTFTGIQIYNQSVDRAVGSMRNELKSKVTEEYKKAGLGYSFQTPGVSKDAPTELKKFNRALSKFK